MRDVMPDIFFPDVLFFTVEGIGKGRMGVEEWTERRN